MMEIGLIDPFPDYRPFMNFEVWINRKVLMESWASKIKMVMHDGKRIGAMDSMVSHF